MNASQGPNVTPLPTTPTHLVAVPEDARNASSPAPATDSAPTTSATATAPVEPYLLTREEAACQLNIGRTTLDGLIASGDLVVLRIGRRVLIDPVDLEAFIDRLRGVG